MIEIQGQFKTNLPQSVSEFTLYGHSSNASSDENGLNRRDWYCILKSDQYQDIRLIPSPSNEPQEDSDEKFLKKSLWAKRYLVTVDKLSK